MKEVIFTIFLGLLLSLAMFFYLFMPYNDCEVIGTSHSYNLEEVKKEMSYHGTKVAYVDEDGQW